MKGLLDRIRELSDCGRCLEDMDFEDSAVPGAVPQMDSRRLKRVFG